jgi:SAM-dependent methyltransferase
MRGLRAWYAADPGQALLDGLQQRLDAWVPELFGYHALQIGNLAPGRDLLAASRIRHRLLIDPVPGQGQVAAQAERLPVAAETVDLVLLPHGLEFSPTPHEILREIDRVLVPEGHLILAVFNPLSLYGGLRLALGWRGRAPWCGRFYGAWRVRDWLSLLGFDTLRCQSYGFRFPLGDRRRLQLMEHLGERWTPYLGGVSLILARKRVATLTPIRPRWRPGKGILRGGLTQPTP